MPTESSSFHMEPGGWVALRQLAPELSDQSPQQLLAIARPFPGNLRYGRNDRDTMLLGEVRGGTVGSGAARLKALIGGLVDPTASVPEPDLIATLLDETGLPWSRRHTQWAIPAASGRPGEVALVGTPGGVRVAGDLVVWEQIEPESRAALAEFLCRVHVGIRFARCELDETAASVVSQTDSEHLESEFQDCVASVLDVMGRIAREAQALLHPDLATRFLRHAKSLAEPEH